ncbi:type II secretion system protein M [Noviherbaspirillum autotrophicum]|uniref:MSHA biogenesis protein MshJ n=1 Tax=Noviherbaspirillum autotrophicum TaxID=709839 RepID=A0A0C1YNW4_9BURK|nr:type II secretion system protein M [Noviherbaspirillum autotrophicum]KIF82282.1 MSHA biogenesis protein MshJ [Noviherbaspirillum autotrophicum]
MKQYWQKLATKIDALTLRERVIIFAMAALIMVVLINAMLLDPQYAKQKQLSERIKLEQSQIAAMQAEIQAKATGQNHDPDSANRVRLGQLEQQFMQMQNTLQGMQKGLISPDRMSSLLEDILRQNRKLRLLSLKTLPAVAAVDAVVSDKKAMEEKTAVQASGSGKDPTNSKPANEAFVYRHGVELVIQGNYLDIMDYLTQLESMQWQVFWGEAKLDVEEYPTNKLTLTLYTLSLDKKWLNI